MIGNRTRAAFAIRLLILVLGLLSVFTLWASGRPLETNLLNLQSLSLGSSQQERAQAPYYGNFSVPLYEDLELKAKQVLAAYEKTEGDSARVSCSPVCREVALAAMVAGQSEKAVASLQEQAALTPDEKSVYLLMGESLARSGDYQQALTAWRQVDADKAFLRSAVYNTNNGLPVRDHFFQVASDIRPEDARIYNEWVKLYVPYHASEDILRVFELAHSRSVEDATLYYQAGLAYRDSGQPDKAQAQFEAAIRLDPTFGRAYVQLADLYWKENKNTEGGFQILEQYRQALPNAPEPYYQIGLAHFGRGNYQAALPFLHQALELGMTTADLYERIGIANYYVSAPDQATSTLEIALQRQDQELSRGLDVPTWRRVNTRVYLALTLWRQGDTVRAQEYACQALKFNPEISDSALKLPTGLFESCSQNEP